MDFRKEGFCMSDKLDGKVALVTGASKGRGQGLAIGLGSAGASVAVNYKTDPTGAEETKRRIQNSGGQSESFQADIGSKQGIEQLVERVYDRFGRVDVLVNNAARTRFGPLFESTEEDFDEVVDTVLRGPFFGSLAAAKKMREFGKGSIINISSIAVKTIMPNHGVYTVAKGGLESMTRQLALELAPEIRVNAIAPTATSNDRNKGYDPNFDMKWSKLTPAGRVAEVDDYTGTCVFLAGDSSALVTGQVIYVDGGWTLQGLTPDMTNFDYSEDRMRG